MMLEQLNNHMQKKKKNLDTDVTPFIKKKPQMDHRPKC